MVYLREGLGYTPNPKFRLGIGLGGPAEVVLIPKKYIMEALFKFCVTDLLWRHT